MRLGESCMYSLRGKCANERAPQHQRGCPYVGEQYYCKHYNGVVPRATGTST
jgi:hypothetical protein